MAELTAAQQQNAKRIMEATNTTHKTIWEAINRYAVSIGDSALPLPAKVVLTGFEHTLNNVVVNELDANPAKYIMGEMVGEVSGVGVGVLLGKVVARFGAAVVIGAGTGGVVLGGLGVKEFFNFAYDKYPGFKNWVDGFNDPNNPNVIPAEFKQYFDDLATETAKAVTESLNELAQDAVQTYEDIRDTIKKAYEDVVQALKPKYEFIANNIVELLNKVGEFINDIWEGILDLFANPTDLSGAWNQAKLGNYDPAAAATEMAAGAQVLTPIALDLNGSGAINTYSLNNTNNKAFFDMDNDGFREKTQWLNPVDGWLAMDRNGDGFITNQNELFGDGGGLLAYQKLAALNTNNTGTSANAITSADAAWNNLRVWIDADVDGISDAGELRTLSSLGITSISLETGVKRGTFTMNGVTRMTQDITVQVAQENSWYMGTAAEINPEALLLPLSRGYGDVKSMHFAASENATLMTQLREIANLPLSGLDSYYTKLQTMVYNWTGATNVVTNPVYGKYLDTQHLYTIERFAGIGTGFYAEQIQDNYVLRSLPFLWSEGLSREKGYEAIMGEFAVRFAAQGALKGILGNPTYDFSADKLVFSSTLSQILSNAVANVPADTVDKNVYWSEIARTLTLYASDFGSTQAAIKTQVDTAAGYAVQINNLGGRYFEGDSGNNTVTGNTLTNYLIGLSGADTLIGGLGDDYLEGGTGADTYRYASGDGNDYIYELTSGADGTSIDKLHFTNSNRSALTFTRVDSNNLVPASGIGANSLRIDVAGGGSVVIRDHFLFDNNAATNAYYRIEQIQFADSTFMDFAASKAATLLSTSGNDTLTGFSDSETITGGAGNDSIRGFDGTDSLLGGSGNDTLYGGIGNDTLEGNSDDDVIYGDDGNDSIIGSTGVDTLFGGAGADSIKGDSGNDSLNGGTENDDIKGGDGDDSVDGGYGNDTIEGGLGFDTILGYDGDDLLDGNSSNDLIYGEKGLDTLYGSEGNDTLYGGNENDSLLGGTGTDNLYGEIGNDYLYGDDGGDNMYGGSGSDTLDGSEGKDNLYGGTGADIFFYNALTDSLNTNPDRIKDFEDGVDVIRLQGLGFTGIAAGAATGTVLGYTQTSTLTTISDAGTFQFIIENGTITLTNADFMFV